MAGLDGWGRRGGGWAGGASASWAQRLKPKAAPSCAILRPKSPSPAPAPPSACPQEIRKCRATLEGLFAKQVEGPRTTGIAELEEEVTQLRNRLTGSADEASSSSGASGSGNK